MTHEELIAKAVERLRVFERLADKVPRKIKGLNVDALPRRTVREAVVIYFESDPDDGHIEVVVDSRSGEVIETKFIPPKESRDEKAS